MLTLSLSPTYLSHNNLFNINLLKHERQDLDPNSPTAAKEWKYWLRTLNNFIAECGNGAPDKYRNIINLITDNVFDYVEYCVNFDYIHTLYIKTPNESLHATYWPIDANNLVNP